jgi:hypothetical protein
VGTRSTPQFHTRRCPPSTTGPELFLLQKLCGITRQSLSGKLYTTTPGGALFFPALALSTGELEVAYTNGPHPTKRGLMMPTRRRTRTQDRAHRIAVERQHNVARIRRRRLLLPAHLARDYEPPPF